MKKDTPKSAMHLTLLPKSCQIRCSTLYSDFK